MAGNGGGPHGPLRYWPLERRRAPWTAGAGWQGKASL